MKKSRRQFLALGAALVAAPRVACAAGRALRIAPQPHGTEQSLPWIAAQSGLYAAHDVEARFVAASDGAVALAALLGGKCDLAHTGISPLARRRLAGGDAIFVATVLEPNKGGFLVAAPRIRAPEQLDGARVGALSRDGPSAQAAGAVLERFGAKAELQVHDSFDTAYAALAAGAIDAAWLPPDLAFKGRAAHGWNAFEGVRLTLPGGYATTRRMIASNRGLINAAVIGLVEAIHHFKTRPAETTALLERLLGVERAVAADLQMFYAPQFRVEPLPTLFYGLPALRTSLLPAFPAAARLQVADLVDSSFVEALSASGVIARLYARKN